MKAIVLENGFERDIPKSLLKYMKRGDIEFTHYDMRKRFWPENREETLKFFSNLPEGQLFCLSTVFDGFMQLELMIQLLTKLKDKKFEIRMSTYSLPHAFVEYLDEPRSELVDEDDELSYQEELDFKLAMNKDFENILVNHKIVWIHPHDEDIHLESVEQIKNLTEG